MERICVGKRNSELRGTEPGIYANKYEQGEKMCDVCQSEKLEIVKKTWVLWDFGGIPKIEGM